MVVALLATTSAARTRNAMKDQQPTASVRPLPADLRSSKGYFARSVGAFIPKVVAAAFERFGFHTAEIMTSWETIVGADLARMTRPETIKWPRGARGRVADDDDARASGATLVVACDPAFALEVSYRTRDIVDRINQYFGYRAIAQLRIVQTPNADGSRGAGKTAREIVQSGVNVFAAGAKGDLSSALKALEESVTATAQAR